MGAARSRDADSQAAPVHRDSTSFPQPLLVSACLPRSTRAAAQHTPRNVGSRPSALGPPTGALVIAIILDASASISWPQEIPSRKQGPNRAGQHGVSRTPASGGANAPAQRQMTLIRGNGVRVAAKHQCDVRTEPQPDRLGDFCQISYHLTCLDARLRCRTGSHIARLCSCWCS